MYLMERLGQLPMGRTFAGTLGKNVLAPPVEAFLKQVRTRPQDHKRLLLTVTFHPLPIESNVKIVIPFQGWAGRHSLPEVMLITGTPPVDFLDELRRISADLQKKDIAYRRQIDAELRLRKVMIKTVGKVGIDREKMKPFLLKPLFLPEAQDFSLPPVALDFAKKMLPPRLVQRIENSAVSEAHLVRLGRFLRRYGEVLQSRDATFKQLVEQERIKRQQVQQEQQEKAKQAEEDRKRKEQRRRRK